MRSFARSIFSFCFIAFATTSFAQNNFTIILKDSATQEPIVGVVVLLKNTSNGTVSGKEGKARLDGLPDGYNTIVIKMVGYDIQELRITLPYDGEQPLEVFLAGKVFDKPIIVEATRANKEAEDLPTRTEVLTEEIDEAASMESSKIAHLITHSTGIQVQTTAATSNGAVVRIQGLNGRYTQMLMDGFPLYGGLSGSLDILQIPPLDLRQVEYVKGSASTLYGAGAIGGLVNLLSKKPDADETLIHLNISHIGAKDFNAFFSRRFGKFGITNLGTLHLHSAYDPDDDGYSDVPEVMKFNFNPKIFFYPDENTEFYLGGQITVDNRMGGDMDFFSDSIPNVTNFYYDKQKSSRYTSQLSLKTAIRNDGTISLKNSITLYDRYIEIRENVAGDLNRFGGSQLRSFSEFNYNLNKEKHNLTIGLNVYTDDFREDFYDEDSLRDQNSLTYGGFVNHLWDIHEKLAMETGLRIDHNQSNSKATALGSAKTFVLPRLSILFKAAKSFNIRAGGGMGYRMPTVFNEESEVYGYKNIIPIDYGAIKPEQSYGANIDFKFRNTFGSKNFLVTLNQMFYYNYITNPIILTTPSFNELSYTNFGDNLNTMGFESQIKMTVWKFTWFFGYTFTEATIQDGDVNYGLPLTPRHSIKGDILFVVDNKWRIGWDYDYKSGQLLSDNSVTRDLFTTGVVVERTLNNFVIFLNAENFTDVRQTNFNESLLSGPNGTPQFTEIYAPLDGFFFNGGLKIKL
ncbi:TonB-dependent receptor plug domain-containing protein [Crocinitomix catalasitica]|nr:TonB-dependent receptor plug domain-containing protein [Crocinitomix catalasitica]